jgi:hypothetical protein
LRMDASNGLTRSSGTTERMSMRIRQRCKF